MANMHGKPRTKAQSYRIQLITQEFGCLACHIEGFSYEPCDNHHCDDKKQDHDRGYGLCLWHHRGEHGGWGLRLSRESKGPSKALEGPIFTQEYGTEQELLDMQNERIAEWEKNSVSSVNYVTSE